MSYNRGNKSVHHHRGTPPFSVCRRPRGHRAQKSDGVYHSPGKTREMGIHHMSGKTGIHHFFHGGGVFFLLTCFIWKGPKGLPAKGMGKNTLKVKKKGKFRVFSGCFQVLSGVFRVFFPIPFAGIPFGPIQFIRYRPKGVFGKGVGNSQNASEMRQKCVKNASEMRQNGSCFIGKRGTSKMRQKSVKIASKLRQKCAEHLWGRTPFGRYRFMEMYDALLPTMHVVACHFVTLIPRMYAVPGSAIAM